MPLYKGEVISPDDAMAKNLCPECAADLTQINAIAHRKSHWKTYPAAGPDGEEGLRRLKMLDDYIVKNKVRTSDMPEPKTPNAAPAA